MKYRLALIGCGVVWFGIAGLCYRTLFSQYPVGHLLCAIVTAHCVGTIFREKIRSGLGWRFFVLWPLLTLATGVTIYGLLLPLSWLIFGRSDGVAGVDAEAFVNMPAIFLTYSFTLYLPVLFPATLATNTALRWILRNEKRA